MLPTVRIYTIIRIVRLILFIFIAIMTSFAVACEAGVFTQDTEESGIAGSPVFPVMEGPPIAPRALTRDASSESTKSSSMARQDPSPEALPQVASKSGFLKSVSLEDGREVKNQLADLVSATRVIVRTLDMEVEVVDVGKSLDNIGNMSSDMGGWVVGSSRSHKYLGAISVRVPAERLDEAKQWIRNIASDVKSEVSTSKDVTDEYVDKTSRLKTLRATEDSLLKLMERSKTVKEALSVRDSLTSVQADIEALEGRVKFLEQTSAFSLINVKLELKSLLLSVDGGDDQTIGVGRIARFRAFFKPPTGTDNHEFTWDFGDGSQTITSKRTAPTENDDTRVTATVTHLYGDEKDSPFIAQVKITSAGDGGVAKGEDTLIVSVTRIPVIEVFAGDTVEVEEDEKVDFNGSFTRPKGLVNVQYKWDFGDGSTYSAGKLLDGETHALATHKYANHRPYYYTATLTITADSEAGKVDGVGSTRVLVREKKGWFVSGWDAGISGKSAVRALSSFGQFIATLLIWVLIFTPVISIIGVVVFYAIRWFRRRKM